MRSHDPGGDCPAPAVSATSAGSMGPATPARAAATIEEHAQMLADAIDAALPLWVVACVDGIHRAWAGITPRSVLDAAIVAGERAQRDVGVRVRALLELDVDQQRTTPLTLLRQAVVYPTEVLHHVGVPPIVRDDYTEMAFPGDLYGLTPGTWADIAPDLADHGIAWGAAKAWVYRHRHANPRESSSSRTGVATLPSASELAEAEGP